MRRVISADFRGGAICLIRTHFLGWSGRLITVLTAYAEYDKYR